MSVRQVHVAADAPSTDQLSNRLRAVLQVGTRLNQQVAPGMETEAPMRNSNNRRANRAGEPAPARGRNPSPVNRRPGGPRPPSPPRRGPTQREDSAYAEDIRDAVAISRAIAQDGLRGDALDRFIRNFEHLIQKVVNGEITMNCGTLDADGVVRNAVDDEDMRRLEFARAAQSLAMKRDSRAWDSAKIGFDLVDACAYEIAGFLVSDDCVVRQSASDLRAAMRAHSGQRAVCSWLDTLLLCCKIPVEDHSDHKVMAYILRDIVQTHVEIKQSGMLEPYVEQFRASDEGFQPLTDMSKVTVEFFHSCFLSKMFQLCEEMLLANTVIGVADDGTLGSYARTKATFEAASGGITFAQMIELDGDVAAQWTAILYKAMFGAETWPDDLPKDSDGPIKPNTITGRYLTAFKEYMLDSWFVKDSQILQCFGFLECKNLFLERRVRPLSADAVSVNSALLPADASRLRRFSQTALPLKALAAKGLFWTTIAVGQAGRLLPTLTNAAVLGANLVAGAVEETVDVATRVVTAPFLAAGGALGAAGRFGARGVQMVPGALGGIRGVLDNVRGIVLQPANILMFFAVAVALDREYAQFLGNHALQFGVDFAQISLNVLAEVTGQAFPNVGAIATGAYEFVSTTAFFFAAQAAGLIPLADNALRAIAAAAMRYRGDGAEAAAAAAGLADAATAAANAARWQNWGVHLTREVIQLLPTLFSVNRFMRAIR